MTISQNPAGMAPMLANLLGEDGYATLRKQGPLPQWKILPLLDAWYRHYGINPDDLGKSTA